MDDERGSGYYEVEVAFEGEEDLHNLYQNCEKNPGHLDFIPITKFHIGDLPTEYQDPDIVDVVKAIADLTVCLAVKRTSQNRPKTFPNSNEPYPHYVLRGSDVLRTGTGWVSGIWKYTNKPCWCTECKQSATPHTTWGYIVVGSATHLVFDDEESKSTKLHLFYDSDNDRRTMYTLTEAQNGFFGLDEDRCVLTFPTHDMALLDRLEALWEYRYQLQRKLRDRYVFPDWLRSYRKKQAVALCNLMLCLSVTAILCFIMINQNIMNMSMTATADLLLLIIAVVALPMLVRPLSDIYDHIVFLFSFHAYYKPREIINLLKYIFNCCYVIVMVFLSARRTLPILEGILTPMYYSLSIAVLISILIFLDGGLFVVVSRYIGAFSVLFFMIYLHVKGIIRFPLKPFLSFWKLFPKLWQLMSVSTESGQPGPRHTLTIVVSHPHGCCKHVTLGEWAFRESKRITYHSKYSYTASTCPGSSGAMVYILGDLSGWMWLLCNHAHSKRCPEDGLNMCGFGYDD